MTYSIMLSGVRVEAPALKSQWTKVACRRRHVQTLSRADVSFAFLLARRFIQRRACVVCQKVFEIRQNAF